MQLITEVGHHTEGKGGVELSGRIHLLKLVAENRGVKTWLKMELSPFDISLSPLGNCVNL